MTTTCASYERAWPFGVRVLLISGVNHLSVSLLGALNYQGHFFSIKWLDGVGPSETALLYILASCIMAPVLDLLHSTGAEITLRGWRLFVALVVGGAALTLSAVLFHQIEAQTRQTLTGLLGAMGALSIWVGMLLGLMHQRGSSTA